MDSDTDSVVLLWNDETSAEEDSCDSLVIIYDSKHNSRGNLISEVASNLISEALSEFDHAGPKKQRTVSTASYFSATMQQQSIVAVNKKNIVREEKVIANPSPLTNRRASLEERGKSATTQARIVRPIITAKATMADNPKTRKSILGTKPAPVKVQPQQKHYTISLRCKECNEIGHTALDCEDVRQQTYGNGLLRGSYNKFTRPIMCTNCESLYHKTRDCPEALRSLESMDRLRCQNDFRPKPNHVPLQFRQRRKGSKLPDRRVPRFQRTKEYYKKPSVFYRD